MSIRHETTINERDNPRIVSVRRWNAAQLFRIGAILVSIGAFTLTVIPLVFHFFMDSKENRRQQLPFHSFAWKQRSYDSDANFMWPTRKRMADDLLKRGLLKQKTRTEVIELLGEPDNASFTSKDGIAYVLGPERGYGVDYEWLQIHFDTRGYVRDVNTTTD